jgi:ribonuclease BN (tRNA processing enzyme)
LKVAFLGTNGWFSTETGNTHCALIDAGTRYVVLDAGDGIRRLAKFAPDPAKPLDIFISHFHLDHVIGLHQLCRFRHRRMRLFVQPKGRKIIDLIVNRPFTDPVQNLHNVQIAELSEGRNEVSDSSGKYAVTMRWLSHADPCAGFRFEFKERGKRKVVAHCLDSGPCDAMRELSAGADLLIAECGNRPGEKSDPAWPHMGPEDAGRMARQAKARSLALTHFAAHKYPKLSDRKRACAAARKEFPKTICARDGLVLRV